MGKLFAQFIDFSFAQIDAIALLENVEQKDGQIPASVVGHQPIAAALAATWRRKSDLACTA
jgi:hypothetical protein